MNGDSHLYNSPPRQRRSKFRPGKTLGIAMVLAGALLLTLISGYYAYSVSARAQLDDLNYVVAQPTQPPLAISTPLATSTDMSPPTVQLTGGSATTQIKALPAFTKVAAPKPEAAAPPSQPTQQATPANQERPILPASSYTSLYPATHIHPKFWAQPLWSGGEPYTYSPTNPGIDLPDGFRAVSASDGAVRRGQGALTSRITIPLIDVDSETKELAILNLGDSRAYETPKHVVGHIPQSPNPGEIGNAWFFGHLESPIRGEGNVFQRLPEIPDLLRDGDDVFVELQSGDGRAFLYKTIRTEVVHQDELELYPSQLAQITLVACVPRLVYDHRIVVTAELVGIKDSPDTVN